MPVGQTKVCPESVPLTSSSANKPDGTLLSTIYEEANTLRRSGCECHLSSVFASHGCVRPTIQRFCKLRHRRHQHTRKLGGSIRSRWNNPENHDDFACERPGRNGVFANVDSYRRDHALYMDAHLRDTAFWLDVEFIDGADQRDSDSGGECHRADLQGDRFQF